MKTRYLFLVLTLLSLSYNSTVAQSDSTNIKVGKLYLSPLPIIASNPAFGFMYGAAASGSIFLGDPATTNMSNAMLTAAWTSKNQSLFAIKSNVYTNNNEWMLMGDWRLFLSSQPTFGLGTGPQGDNLSPGHLSIKFDDSFDDGELMDFNLIRFYQSGLKQVAPSLYVGLGYHLDIYSEINDHLLDLDAPNPVYTNHYLHSIKHGFDPTGYTISGASANVIYDTRDNIANPYTGRYINASYRYNAELLGSDKNSSTLWMEYRDYFNVNPEVPRNLIAVWTYANVTTSGTLPYMALPAIGWDQMGRSGRGYAQGRWRGDDMFYAEAEYRFRLPLMATRPDLFGGVIFANATSASNRDENVKLFQHWEPAIGAGIRIQIQKQTRTNLSIDYGWGPNGGGAIYLNLTEYF